MTIIFCSMYRGQMEGLPEWLEILNRTLSRYQIEYCSQSWAPVYRHGNWSVMLRLEGIQRRERKLIKRVKYYR